MEEYYYKKLLQAICFTNNVKIYLNNKLLEPIFIEHFTALLLENSTKGMVNEQMRYNLLAVANYLRYNGCAELANECILLINNKVISRENDCICVGKNVYIMNIKKVRCHKM